MTAGPNRASRQAGCPARALNSALAATGRSALLHPAGRDDTHLPARVRGD
ncbi:hypothetical protein AB0E00_22945 [Streptomyces sp. NPDC048110]